MRPTGLRSDDEKSMSDSSDMSGVATMPAENKLEDCTPEADLEKQPVDEEESKREPPDETDPNLVVFTSPNDRGNPKNWSPKRRVAITLSMASMTFVVTFSSSIFAVTLGPVSEEYNIGTVTAALGIGLFLLVCILKSISVDDRLMNLGICTRSRRLR